MTPGEEALWAKMKQGEKTEGLGERMEAECFDRSSQESGEIFPVILKDT